VNNGDAGGKNDGRDVKNDGAMNANRKPRALAQLESADDFSRRHIGPDGEQCKAMLRALGLGSMEELVERVIPRAIRTTAPFHLPAPMSERETITCLRRMRERNRIFISMIGMGYHGSVLPGVIRRNVLENPGWYTAYTPYQAEVSQGRLAVLLSFQQMVMDLTGMELANASLLDEATAAAEAMATARRVSGSESDTFFVAADCHPQTIAVVQTRARAFNLKVTVGEAEAAGDGDCFGALLQYPASGGAVADIAPVIKKVRQRGAVAVVASDLLALTLLKPPGEMGADIVVGSAQRFGVPLGYGGPHAAFFAARAAYRRNIPGRIIGVSVDARGKPALRMALQTREQHIRREKATSNICTAQVLLAIISALYACYHGPGGLRAIAERVHRMARILALGLARMGFSVTHDAFFDTVTVHVRGQAARIAARARESRINLRVVDSDRLGIALDETTRRANLGALWRVFHTGKSTALDVDRLDAELRGGDNIPAALRRTSPYLQHAVFNSYHSETRMLRYLRELCAKDIALDRAMIPLGSCTMKLNATTEMLPVTYRQFSALHPFAPLDQVQGYQQLFEELEMMLCDVTGFDAVSLQPNAGSQGEYAGLLCIKRYHAERGEARRNLCLIPSSAHGTNPASAVMAGMTVMTVDCDASGNVDTADLEQKARGHRDTLAALMITYPSTHGVFEEAIVDICKIIHDNGGQVYLDGANLNALLGHCRPGEVGADVSHMNLHKTFCIPHGGGGPGMGPIGVKQHLAPYLPDHPLVEGVNPAASESGTIGPVAAAPWGSAGILAISWAYIAMMGAAGLRRATEAAILNANYIAARLAEHYPVVYTGAGGMVAHECIVDLRPLKETSGVTVEDVAKRLVDYGFHAPTMSWPVADTLMIEPTESESKQELDRFCDAMISIRKEIAEIETGQADPEDNLLRHAPHTHDLLIADHWSRPYSRQRAFFPAADTADNKYWPPVGRVDNVAGDRKLVAGVG